MKEYKRIWTEQDFEIMGWHDCRLYGINFLKEAFTLELNIDYIFNWNLNEGEESGHEFTVAPCLLKFIDYSHLEVNIPWGQTYDFIISEIRRTEPVSVPSATINLKAYEIILETGYIKLQAARLKMDLLAEPVVIETQDIDIEERKRLIEKSRH